jgi:hypothetical protein
MLKYAGFSHVIAEDRTDQVCPSSCVQRPCSCSFPLVVFCLDLKLVSVILIGTLCRIPVPRNFTEGAG